MGPYEWKVILFAGGCLIIIHQDILIEYPRSAKGYTSCYRCTERNRIVEPSLYADELERHGNILERVLEEKDKDMEMSVQRSMELNQINRINLIPKLILIK